MRPWVIFSKLFILQSQTILAMHWDILVVQNKNFIFFFHFVSMHFLVFLCFFAHSGINIEVVLQSLTTKIL